VAGDAVAVTRPFLHIGTSGWSYEHWDGVLYPQRLPAPHRLEHYTREFRTVELNASYYRWPADRAFAGWRRRLPEDFTLSVKAPGALTHVKRLYAPESWLARMTRGLGHLGPRAGPLLVQLPPTAEFDRPRLAYFLQCVPARLRVAVEFRHPSWHQAGTFELLKEHGAAYCVMSGANLPCILEATAPFVYARLHGPDHRRMYAGSYSDDDLRWWADRIAEWQAAGRDVFLYFNNDGAGNAVRNARTLIEMIGAAA
jgi:uncharacterized protein YecE (DUF72 family)